MIKLLLAFALVLSSKLAFAFPEMVRHDYPHCSSCHVSPSGGGVLTSYGRELSRELLSTWGRDNKQESMFAYGLVKTPEEIDLTAMFRRIWVYTNREGDRTTRSIPMEADLEAAYDGKQWKLDAVAGYKYLPEGQRSDNYFLSRRHFIAYQPKETLSFRVGRFFPNMGLMIPDHIAATRVDLGFSEGQETYNLEAALLHETWSLFVTAYTSRDDVSKDLRERALVLTPAIVVHDHYKLGLNALLGRQAGNERMILGAWGILGFTPHFFLLSEVDFQETRGYHSSIGSYWGMVDYQRLDYEIVQGVHVYLQQEYSQLNFRDPLSVRRVYGLGTQFFPRPHFEFNLAWQRRKKTAQYADYTDYAYLMFNFYL